MLRGRATIAFVVAPFLTFASALAPQHIHEAGAGHEHAVAHSHFDPYHLDVHDSADIDIEKDIDHEHVVYLDSPILHESPHHVFVVPLAIPVNFESLPAVQRWSVTQFEDSAPVHGPPRRANFFRGPPPFLA